jgi:hypothetical protein
MATNRATADFMIASPLFNQAYDAPTGGGNGEPETETGCRSRQTTLG